MDNIKETNLKPIYIHPEEEPTVDEINSNITQVNSDLSYIDNTLTTIASNYDELMTTTKMKLSKVKELINREKERQEDINILCNKYSDFSSVLNLTAENFEGNLEIENGLLTAPILSSAPVTYQVDDVSGNGQPGNSYVYQNDKFISDTLNTNSSLSIIDDSLSTYYEYSRITMNNSEEAPLIFNRDSKEAECSIMIYADEDVNKILVNSDRDDLVLKEVYTSIDGISFKLDKEYNVQINKNQEKYNDQSYIYGSGIISVPPTQYIKLCFKSNGYTDENIAYIKAFNDNNSVTKKIQKVISAKRHVVKINGITLSKNVYTKGASTTKELVTDPIKYIGLCCNEYVSSDNQIEDVIKYYLIINGTEHEIVPINSQRNGKKIIRTSSQTYQLDNTIYIEESIKSAKLKVVVNGSSSVTPYISNMKILIGGYN